jgi:hypothetical protein
MARSQAKFSYEPNVKIPGLSSTRVNLREVLAPHLFAVIYLNKRFHDMLAAGHEVGLVRHVV